MHIDDKKLKKQSFVISILLTIVICFILTLYEVRVLKNKIKLDILPIVSQDLNNIALHTQNQLQLIQFTTIQHRYIFGGFKLGNADHSSSKDKNAIDICLNGILLNPETLEFSNRKKFRAGQIENNDGALLGNGDLNRYSKDELSLLCLIVLASQASSESLRLVKSNIKKLSSYYYASRLNDYILLYDTSFSQSFLEKYNIPKVREIFNNANDIERNYWITGLYTSGITKNTVLSFVKNVVDYKGQITGFLVRDIHKEDFKTVLTSSLNKIDGHLNINKHSSVQVLNNNNVIYESDDLYVDGKNKDDIVIQGKNKGSKWSDFGPLTIKLFISKKNLLLLMVEVYDFLLLIPIFIFIFIYIAYLKIMKGFDEADKQYYDILTQAYNRRGLNAKVFKKIKKEVENNHTAHLFLLDANNFKQINDKFGHESGDRAIKLIARTAKNICSPYDDVIRLGGDEFLVVLYIKNGKDFNHEKYIERFNEKIAYDCRLESLPSFTISAGYVTFNNKSHQTLSQVINQADRILLNKKSIDKINQIYEVFNSYGISLSGNEVDIKLSLKERFKFVEIEHLLQNELNDRLLNVYNSELNYLVSNYFKMMYSYSYENDNLHQFRMKVIDSHYQSGVPISVFYFLFVKYSSFLFDNVNFTTEERMVNNRVLAYELHFISHLKAR